MIQAHSMSYAHTMSYAHAMSYAHSMIYAYNMINDHVMTVLFIQFNVIMSSGTTPEFQFSI